MSHLNQTYIFLIPKKSNTLSSSDYLLISICNVILNIVTKTIANRIKPRMDKIVNSNQSAFILDRLVNENVILAYESFHSLNRIKVGIKPILGLSCTWSKLMIGFNGILLIKILWL